MRKGRYALATIPVIASLVSGCVSAKLVTRQDLLAELTNYRTAIAEMDRTLYPAISASCSDDPKGDACVPRYNSYQAARQRLLTQGAEIVKQVGEDAAVGSLGQGFNPQADVLDEWALRDMIQEATGEWPEGDWY